MAIGRNLLATVPTTDLARRTISAVREFDRLPQLHPQFGDPLYDLTAETGQIYIGVIPPITMRYGVFEDRRLVICGALPTLMPMARPDSPANE